MRPIIGISTYYVRSKELKDSRPRGLAHQDLVMLTTDYVNYVLACGGTPLLIPVIETDKKEIYQQYIDKIDGLLLTGGPDITPKYYHQKNRLKKPYYNELRDANEYALLDIAFKAKKAIIGVCRGHQLLNIYFGGELYQDLPTEYGVELNHRASFQDKTKIAHQVTFEKNSCLYRAFGEKTIKVNSFHHQGIHTLGEGLEVIAKAEDGLIEGICYPKRPWVIGIQWHPEMFYEKKPIQKKLMKAFIDHIKEGMR